MIKLSWSELCPGGECIHLVEVQASNLLGVEHHHDFYECIVLHSGRLRHGYGKQHSDLEWGALVFVQPQHAHVLQAVRGHELRFTNLAFAAEVVESFAQRHPAAQEWSRGMDPLHCQLTTGQKDQMDRLLLDLRAGERSAFDAEYGLLGLHRLLNSSTQTVSGERCPLWLSLALEEVRLPEDLRLGVSDLVRRCGRSPEHVSRAFRRYLQVTPSQWLMQQRLAWARRMLDESSLSILEIGLDCGMESPSYFHRCFKKAYGCTPRHYRMRSQGVQSPSLADSQEV